MQTKTYFASSVPMALELARKELGEDALLVTSRPSPPATRALGRLEVTFAWDPKPEPAAATVPFGAVPFGSVPFGMQRALQTSGSRAQPSELDEIREQISALRLAMGRPGGDLGAFQSPGLQQSEPRDYLSSRLIDGGLQPDTAREIALAAAGRPGDRHGAMLQELAGRLPCAPFAELKAGETKTLAFVGPPGRGKSTTLVKVAARFGLAKRVPVKIYTAGSHGICGEEQMARFATILGVPFFACESLESLSLALNGDTWKGLALIDTPGISPAENLEIAEFAKFFGRWPEIEKHLVLRADARSADMSGVISRFSAMGVSRLLFTGVDETLSLGAMAETLLRGKIPVTFVGTGQQLPDDLETISAAGLARAVCGEKALAAMAA
jgi:flagellar biosynthesis protein FlhF